MKRMSDSLFVASTAGMEFCWIYAWVVFVMHPILNRPFPLAEALATFALAGILTAACRGGASIRPPGVGSQARRSLNPAKAWPLSWKSASGDCGGR